MKFAWKIFFVSFLVIIIFFGFGGFLLINSVFSSSLSDKTRASCDNNSYITASFYALERNSGAMGYSTAYNDFIVRNFTSQVSNSSRDTTVKIGGRSLMNEFDNKDFVNSVNEDTRAYRLVKNEGKHFLQVISRIKVNEKDFYIETLTDISEVYKSRDSYCSTYSFILMGVALAASLVLVFVSMFLTRPLVKLSNVTREIAQGDLSKRVEEKSKTKELYELSESFNTMAENIELYTDELKKSAQSRDDFVANFTHELKTPLTSVIGYADMLRTYELTSEKRRECADFIFKEGKRLEALSATLLNIMVLKNDEIKLVPIGTEHLLNETGNSVIFLLKKYKITLDAYFENATVLAEPSLIKTLLYNLIDNACKACEPESKLKLSGELKDDRYTFTVEDNGRGMSEEELEKITLPFYMVDKSRARSMGGAGLGLALCAEIARLHSTELRFESEQGKGTRVSFSLPICKEGDYEQEA